MIKNQNKKKVILKLSLCNCTKKISALKKQENILFDKTLIIFLINSIVFIQFIVMQDNPKNKTNFNEQTKKLGVKEQKLNNSQSRSALTDREKSGI